MANETNTATELIETQEVAEAPQVKTKKELKKERKEIKKHKKEVKKEAALHSAKATKFYKFMMAFTSIVVIVSMLFCSFTAIKFTKSMGETSAPADTQQTPADTNTGNTGNTGNNGTSDTKEPADTGDASTGEEGSQAPSADAGDPTDVNSKAGAVDLFKKAHAKVLAEAKSVTRTLDNNTNYKEYLEVGGNSALAGVAKTLMGTFLKANEEQLVYSGADIATNFPPTKNSCEGLTADMIGEFSVKEEGDNYIVTLSINSTEEAPDLGDNSQHLINIVDAKTVEEAAAGFVGFTGLRNEYIAPTVTAKINKASGQMLELHTICPSYMKFDRATVMSIINVDNVGIGLQYETKWTIQW